MTTGQRIKAARKKAGMTQAALAEKLGISYVNISQLEKDQRNPKLETLQRIAAALGTSISNLLPPDNYWEDENGVSHTEPQVVEHEGPLQRAEVVERSATPEEMERLLARLQDGEPVLLSPDELAKLKATPKKQVSSALEKMERKEVKIFRPLRTPVYKMAATISPEQVEKLKAITDQAERAMGQTGRVARFNRKFSIKSPQIRIAAALDKLNEEGQEKAAERVEELTEIPRYQVQEPPTAPPQDPPAPQEGTDTTPAEVPPEGPQEPPEGRIQSITMTCPICGQHLRGDLSSGKAYCNYCNRSFPLPQILK